MYPFLGWGVWAAATVGRTDSWSGAASWGAVRSDSWVWGSGQRRRSDGQINGLGRRPGELYVAIPGFGGLDSGDGRTDRLKVWGGGLGSCM